VLKCKTSEKEQFHDIALIISRERARFTNYQFLPCQYGKIFFYKELKNITIVTKYNLFTVNKWIFTTLKSILY